MSGLDLTAFDPALKVHYGPQELMEISLRNRPLYGLMPKYTNFGGKSMPVPLKYGANPNVSANFQTSQRTGGASGVTGFDPGSSSQVEFSVKRIKKYGTPKIDGEVIRAAQGDVNSFVTAVTHEFDATLERLADRTHHDLYRGGLGLIDGVTVSGTTTVLTLDNRESMTALEVGDLVVAREGADAEGALINSGEIRQVTALDRDAGTVTINAAFTGFASTDTGFLFHAGDRQAAAITATSQWLCCSGVESWIPATAPTSGDDHWGVDRSVDPTKLAGVRVSGVSTIVGSLKKAAFEIGRIGSTGANLTCFMNLSDVDTLLGELESKVEYQRMEARGPDGAFGKVGFDAIQILTPVGRMMVVPDHACPKGTAFVLDLSTWMLASAGPYPALLEEDGQVLLRLASEDAYEGRFGGYWQAICMAPGRNGRVALP